MVSGKQVAIIDICLPEIEINLNNAEGRKFVRYMCAISDTQSDSIF